MTYNVTQVCPKMSQIQDSTEMWLKTNVTKMWLKCALNVTQMWLKYDSSVTEICLN